LTHWTVFLMTVFSVACLLLSLILTWNFLKYYVRFLYRNHQAHRDLLITLYKQSWTADKSVSRFLCNLSKAFPCPHHMYYKLNWMFMDVQVEKGGGSILCPLPFLIFINDLSSTMNCIPKLYTLLIIPVWLYITLLNRSPSELHHSLTN
jgi:hypothetical protein